MFLAEVLCAAAVARSLSACEACLKFNMHRRTAVRCLLRSYCCRWFPGQGNVDPCHSPCTSVAKTPAAIDSHHKHSACMRLVAPRAARVVPVSATECIQQLHSSRVACMAAAKRTATETQGLPALIAFDLDGTLWCATAHLPKPLAPRADGRAGDGNTDAQGTAAQLRAVRRRVQQHRAACPAQTAGFRDDVGGIVAGGQRCT